jgi:DNA transformation protein
MKSLTDLPNIGNVLAGKLIEAGIKTPDDLFDLGAEEAFLRIKMVDGDACLSKLCALEGAVRGIRWHNLSADRKEELQRFIRILCVESIF